MIYSRRAFLWLAGKTTVGLALGGAAYAEKPKKDARSLVIDLAVTMQSYHPAPHSEGGQTNPVLYAAQKSAEIEMKNYASLLDKELKKHRNQKDREALVASLRELEDPNIVLPGTYLELVKAINTSAAKIVYKIPPNIETTSSFVSDYIAYPKLREAFQAADTKKPPENLVPLPNNRPLPRFNIA